MILAGLCGLVVLAMLTLGVVKGVRVIAALGVAAANWGWGVAQYPVLLPDTPTTLTDAGAPHGAFVALIILFIGVVVIIGPALALRRPHRGRPLRPALRGFADGSVGYGRPSGKRPRQQAAPAGADAWPGLPAEAAPPSRRVRRQRDGPGTATHQTLCP